MEKNYMDIDHSNEDLSFHTISEFKQCMLQGGEVEFVYNGKAYSITHPNGIIDIGEGYYLGDGIAYNVESHQKCTVVIGIQSETADGILEYVIDGVRLRDIITKIEVVARTI